MSMYLWYGYLLVIAAILGLGAIAKIFLKVTGRYEALPYQVQLEELITIPFLAVSVVGMYGALQGVSFLSQGFWQVYLVLLVIYTVAAFWMPKQKFLKSKVSERSFWILSLVGYATNFPMFYLLYEYAFVTFPQGGIA